MTNMEKKIVVDSDVSDSEQYEGGEVKGNIIFESLMRVRQKNAQNQNKWQDKSRFGKVASKVKKDHKVEDRVKRQHIKAKIADFLAGKRDVPSPRNGHSPNTRTLGLWVDHARKQSRSGSRRGGTPRQEIEKNGPEFYGDSLRTRFVGYADVPLRNTEIATSSTELTTINLTVPKKSKRKTGGALHNTSVDRLLKPGKRMQEVARAASPNLTNSLYQSSASPLKKKSFVSKRKTNLTVKNPEMTFNKDPESGISGAVFTSPAVNEMQASHSPNKRTHSWKKASAGARASYMQPTFSKQMLLARSGQISALVGQTRQGRPVVLETQNANSPTVNRVSDFSFAPISPALTVKQSKRPRSMKKSMRSSIYNQAAPLSMTGIKTKYQVHDLSQLDDLQVANELVPDILSSSAKKQKMVSPANQTYVVRETAQNGPSEAYSTASVVAAAYVNRDQHNTAKRAKIAEMDAAFENLQGELAGVRAKKNVDFYDDHNNNYYKGQLKRD